MVVTADCSCAKVTASALCVIPGWGLLVLVNPPPHLTPQTPVLLYDVGQNDHRDSSSHPGFFPVLPGCTQTTEIRSYLLDQRTEVTCRGVILQYVYWAIGKVVFPRKSHGEQERKGQLNGRCKMRVQGAYLPLPLLLPPLCKVLCKQRLDPSFQIMVPTVWEADTLVW